MSSLSPRLFAVEALTAIIREKRLPEQLFGGDRYLSLPDADRTLSHQLIMGTLRNLRLLEAVIQTFCKRPLRHLHSRVRFSLITAAYQMLFLDRVPNHASVHEAVEMVKRSYFRKQAGFVNAVLRRVSEIGDVDQLLKLDLETAHGLGIRFSYPTFLVQRWLDNYPRDQVRSWLERGNENPPHFLTLRPSAGTLADFQERCVESGVSCEPVWPEIPQVRVSGPSHIWRTWTEQDLCFSQDPWSFLVAFTIPRRPCSRILDLCAAPGNKSFVLSACFPDAVHFLNDLQPERLNVVRQRAGKLGLESLHFTVGDARQPPYRAGSVDLALVDAPCSGTGTLQRNPDLRWRLENKNIPFHARRQREILAAAARMVRGNGMLVYITCSAEREENQEVVLDFLKREEGRFNVVSPGGFPAELITKDGFVQTFPAARFGEGFFAAYMRRNN